MFVTDRVTHVRQVTGEVLRGLQALDDQYAAIYREHPFLDSPDFVDSLRDIIGSRSARSIIDDPQ